MMAVPETHLSYSRANTHDLWADASAILVYICNNTSMTDITI